jgi:hypothetical protein
MEITIFNGKTHYKWPFSTAMLNYQRVSLRYILYSDCGCNQLCGDPWILRGSIDAGGRPKDIFDDDDVAKQDSNGIRTAVV